MTYGELYGPAMKITEQEEADKYFAMLVDHAMTEFGKTRGEAEELERHNLGYFAGYYDHKTRERVERLFKCKHPIFGSIAEKGPPDPEAAFNIGYQIGRAGRTWPPTPRGRV